MGVATRWLAAWRGWRHTSHKQRRCLRGRDDEWPGGARAPSSWGRDPSQQEDGTRPCSSHTSAAATICSWIWLATRHWLRSQGGGGRSRRGGGGGGGREGGGGGGERGGGGRRQREREGEKKKKGGRGRASGRAGGRAGGAAGAGERAGATVVRKKMLQNSPRPSAFNWTQPPPRLSLRPEDRASSISLHERKTLFSSVLSLSTRPRRSISEPSVR